MTGRDQDFVPVAPYIQTARLIRRSIRLLVKSSRIVSVSRSTSSREDSREQEGQLKRDAISAGSRDAPATLKLLVEARALEQIAVNK